jgi:probable HAF family extracellular repeat protein
MRFGGLVAMGLFLGALNQAKGESNYSYTTFKVPGSTATFPYAINSSGQIVGNYLDANGVPHGFLLSGGAYTTFDQRSRSVRSPWLERWTQRIMGLHGARSTGGNRNPTRYCLTNGFLL